MSNIERDNTKGFQGMLSVTVYLLAAAWLRILVTRFCKVDFMVVKAGKPGLTNLTDFDFGSCIARVTTESTQSITIYAGALYSPDDFAAGNISIKDILYNQTEAAQGDYSTLRMELMPSPSQVYVIVTPKTVYVQRLFIDGKKRTAIGIPGNSAENTGPDTARFVEGFKPQEETTEIIFYYSNFVHADGGGLYPMDIGTVKAIVQNEQLDTIRSTAVAVIKMFFFGLFLLFKRYKYLLWFALVCGCIALRVVGSGILPPLLSTLSWFVQIRLSYIGICCMALFASLYIARLFPGAINKWVLRGFAVFCSACIVFISISPSTMFTRYPVHLSLAYIGFVAHCLLYGAVAFPAGRAELCAVKAAAQAFAYRPGSVRHSFGGAYFRPSAGLTSVRAFASGGGHGRFPVHQHAGAGDELFPNKAKAFCGAGKPAGDPRNQPHAGAAKPRQDRFFWQHQPRNENTTDGH